MKIIDSHIHVGQWGKTFFNYKTDLEEAVSIMKKSKISAAVCIPADKEPNQRLLRNINKIKDFKFYFAAWIDPHNVNLENFIEQNQNEINFFKFHPSIQKIKITDKKYIKYIKLANDLNIPIIVHCGRWKEVAGFSHPLKIAEKFPELNIILAHLGGDQPSIYLECAEIVKQKKYKNVYLGTESVREFYFVNIVVKKVGSEKIIFGSDYNLGLPEMYIPIIDSLKISNEEKELIFSKNILRILNE